MNGRRSGKGAHLSGGDELPYGFPGGGGVPPEGETVVLVGHTGFAEKSSLIEQEGASEGVAADALSWQKR